MAGKIMKAMVLERIGEALRLMEVPRPSPKSGELLLRVRACAVCRTDLHIVDGELEWPKLPRILGHEIVGEVAAIGAGVEGASIGDRMGVPWLGKTCGKCAYCAEGRENLCESARFTGYDIDGGYAEYCVANARFCFPMPVDYPDVEAAPLLCAGLIGFRALRMAGAGRRLGLYGFGAAAHIIAQVATHEGREVFAFSRPGDVEAQAFARSRGVSWAGDSGQAPPVPLDAAILFAPVGALVPEALARVRKGGVVVCAGIHMSEIPAFSYDLLWGERVLRSVANLTRRDGLEFFELVERFPPRTHVQRFALSEANTALDHLRSGQLEGAAVLVIRD